MKKYLKVEVIEAEDIVGLDIRNGEQHVGYAVQNPAGDSSFYPKKEFEKIAKEIDPLDFGVIVDIDTRTGEWEFCKEFIVENESIVADNLTFGEALQILKLGGKVARKGWNGKGMFIYLQSGSIVSQARNSILDDLIKEKGSVEICGHIDMKAADGKVVIGWLSSQTDMLAEDWQVV